MCAGPSHSKAEKTTEQRREEEGLLQRLRDPNTPAHEVRRAVALLLHKGLHRGRLTMHMYTSAISALGRVHACEEAVALLETMRQRALTPNVISYNAATSACKKCGQWQRALEVLEGMPQRAPRRHFGSSVAILAQAILAQAQAVCGRVRNPVAVTEWLDPATE